MQSIELQQGGRLYEGAIQSLSKFGALIQTASTFPVGAAVRLTFVSATGTRVSVMVTVVSRIDPPRAVRLGIAPGIAVHYAANTDADAQRFASAITRAQNGAKGYEPKKTRPMIAPILSSLLFATKRGREDAPKAALQGCLDDFDAATLCSAMERTRHSGRLKLEHNDRIATIDFVDGEIVRVQASWQHHGPRKVLRDVLGWTTGSFELRSVPTVRTPTHDGLRVSHLLLDRAAQP